MLGCDIIIGCQYIQSHITRVVQLCEVPDNSESVEIGYAMI